MPYAHGCHGCGKKTPNYRCKVCLRAHREREARRRDERRAAGLCLTCGTPVAKSKRIAGGKIRINEPAVYCTAHLAYYAARASA